MWHLDHRNCLNFDNETRFHQCADFDCRAGRVGRLKYLAAHFRECGILIYVGHVSRNFDHILERATRLLEQFTNLFKYKPRLPNHIIFSNNLSGSVESDLARNVDSLTRWRD